MSIEKSVGYDGILNEILKLIDDKSMRTFTRILKEMNKKPC